MLLSGIYLNHGFPIKNFGNDNELVRDEVGGEHTHLEKGRWEGDVHPPIGAAIAPQQVK